MINLQTLEIEIPKDVESVLLHLYVHTERLEITSLNFPIYNLMPDKSHTWRGEIDRTNKTFRLVPGTEETGFHAPSRIVIRGEITSNGKKTSLKIKLQPTGSVFFNNAALITITIVTAILIPNNTFFSNWWIAIVWLLLLMGNFVRLNNDLNKTTKKLIQYFRALTDGA